MTPAEYRAAIAKMEWSIAGAAPHLGISRRQSQRYASGENPVSAPIAKLLQLRLASEAE